MYSISSENQVYTTISR